MQQFLWLACEKQLVLLPDTSEEHSQNHFIKLTCLYFFNILFNESMLRMYTVSAPLPPSAWGGQLSVNDVLCQKRFCKTKYGFQGSISNVDPGFPGGTYDVPCQKRDFVR